MERMPSKDELKEYYKNNFWSDVWSILKPRNTPETPYKRGLLFIGSFVSLLSALGLLGFTFAYERLNLREKNIPPTLNGKPTVVYATMVFFGIGLPILAIVLGVLGFGLTQTDFKFLLPVFGWLFINFLITQAFLGIFSFWQNRIYKQMETTDRMGSARFATVEELDKYRNNKSGIYFGEGLTYSASGHVLTVAGTRGGKGTNLILPNLLGIGNYKGSWVVLDPKGENAAISGKYQNKINQEVVYLNPWGMLGMPESGFNPFDIFDSTNPNLVDDIQLISEAIVPYNPKDEGASDFFNSMARSFITGFMLHILTSDKAPKTLGTLWKWLRLPQEKLKLLLAEMYMSESQVAGEVIKTTAYTMGNLISTSEREFSSIMSSAQKWTNFLGSPALQNSLNKSSFEPISLSEGKTTIYIMIPPDRLKTHYQWLRLVVSSLMKVVIRKPNKKVTFLLDEAATIGYLSEIETALGAYAGYNLTVWSIFQDLNQIKRLYADGWETFMGNCSLKSFFNIGDNFSAEYLSRLFGKTSIPKFSANDEQSALGFLGDASERDLITTDELRRASGDLMFTIVDSLSVAPLLKSPYYEQLKEGVDFEPNPYFKP